MTSRVTEILEQQKRRQELCLEHRISQLALNVWKYITDYIDKMGYAPSYTEIAVSCYLGDTSVAQQLKSLEGKGFIKRPEKHLPRSTQLTVRCPLSPEVAQS